MNGVRSHVPGCPEMSLDVQGDRAGPSSGLVWIVRIACNGRKVGDARTSSDILSTGSAWSVCLLLGGFWRGCGWSDRR